MSEISYNDNYLLKDPQLGDVCFINGKSSYDFNADLIDYEPVQLTITSDLIKKIGKNSYIINQYNNNDNGVTLRFYVGGTTKQQAQVNYNILIRELQKDIVTIVISDTEFEYVGILKSVNVVDTKVPFYYLIEATLVAIKRLPAKILQFDEWDEENGEVIDNDGVIESGLMIAINNDLTSEEIEVELYEIGSDSPYYTMSITNADEYSYHVIDGFNGKILRGTTPEGIFLDSNDEEFQTYQNNFANTILYDFPRLIVGQTEIHITGGINKVILKTYPLFLV